MHAQAAYHGVPLVGIPMYGDQPDNSAKAVHRGFGLLVPAKHLQVGALVPCTAGCLLDCLQPSAAMPCTPAHDLLVLSVCLCLLKNVTTHSFKNLILSSYPSAGVAGAGGFAADAKLLLARGGQCAHAVVHGAGGDPAGGGDARGDGAGIPPSGPGGGRPHARAPHHAQAARCRCAACPGRDPVHVARESW